MDSVLSREFRKKKEKTWLWLCLFFVFHIKGCKAKNNQRSAIDISNTKKVKEGAELLTIELFDHIIVGADATYCSLREQGNF